MRWVVLLLGLVCLAFCEKAATVTRTQLYVARSLNPDATETRTVRTKTGEVATLVVKRRDGKQLPPPPPANPDNFPKVNTTKIPAEANRTAKSEVRIPDPVLIRSTPVLVKGEHHEWKRGRNLMKIDTDGVPVITGVRVPDTEDDKKHVWRNARVINGVLVPNEKTQEKQMEEKTTTPEFKSPGKIEWLKMEPITRPIQPVTQENMWYRYPESQTHKPVILGQNLGQVWQPAGYRQEQVHVVAQPIHPIPENNKYVTDKILEYIQSVNREEILKRQRMNVGNARGSRGMRDAPKIEARVLHTSGATVYPTSLLYAPPSSQNGRVRVEEGVRTPILQYAHPELGVQAALVSPPEEVDNVDFGRDKALAYFAHDIHSDRSPFAFEPGLEDEARVEDFTENDKRSNNGYSHRPKKTLSYFYNDQALPYSGKHYGKYHNYKDHYNHKYNEYVDRRPFWEKLGDSIKEHVEYGMEKVQDITRPVMEPLVEASHKISENLGFHTGNRDLNTFKEKLGVAGSSSMLLPALGLVAGGAALGLGAVAVGRFLDVDMLKRSGNGVNNFDNMPVEHKRALMSIAQGNARYKRSLREDALQNIETIQPSGVTGINEAAWASTPCAKRAFCQVLVSQSHEDVNFMEKKMAAYLKMLGKGVAEQVGPHLDEVMSAIRRRDCSLFQCPADPFPR